jgi:hypothetical protein
MAAAAVAATGLVAVAAPAAYAQTGCRVSYEVTGQWQGGFQGAVSVTNLGGTLNGWQLTFRFPAAGQSVDQGWGGVWSQAGADVIVRNESWNGSLGTGASADLGFIGAYSGTNPSPTAFSLNGVACTGGTTPTTPPTTPPTTTPPPQQDPWNPPANLATGLNQVWQHYEDTYPQLHTFNNYGWDQVMANGGYINYCVRWDSSAPVSATLRDEIHTALARSFKKWMDVLVENGQGWDGWPHNEVPVRVVGWAVRDRSTLQWSDNSVDIYVNDIRENAPQCATACGRFFNRGGSYPNCPGGYDRHYDMSLWLTSGFGGGHGGDWGQRMGSEYFVNARNSENITILLHEIGHSFGLDDFYDWTPAGVSNFIMKAGTSSQITAFDAWMLRDWWRHLKSRYGF